jgi:hypothetical protein
MSFNRAHSLATSALGRVDERDPRRTVIGTPSRATTGASTRDPRAKPAELKGYERELAPKLQRTIDIGRAEPPYPRHGHLLRVGLLALLLAVAA